MGNCLTRMNFCEGNLDMKNISLKSRENKRIMNFLNDINNGNFDYFVEDFLKKKSIKLKNYEIPIFSNNYENLKNKRLIEIFKFNILRKIIAIQKNFKDYISRKHTNLKAKSQKKISFNANGNFNNSNSENNLEGKNYNFIHYFQNI